MKRMTECAIHLAQLEEPIQLKCQHTFCRKCIIRWVESPRSKTCPECRENINYTVDELKKLEISLVHKQIIDIYNEQQKEIPKRGKLKPKKFEKKVKISFIGSSSSGKTSLMRNLAGFPFIANTIPTIGTDSVIIDFENNTELIKVHLWDTCGQENYRSITNQYYRNSKGIILVFDFTAKFTFDAINVWLEDIREYCTDDDLIIALVGNKIDLIDEREVSSEHARAVADQHNLLYYETSAKTGQNVQFLFDSLVRKICNMMEFNDEKIYRKSTISLSKNVEKAGKNSCC